MKQARGLATFVAYARSMSNHVIVPLANYISGGLPDVCIVTGQATERRYTHTTEVLPDDWVKRILHRTERILSPPPRFGRVIVVRGQIPLASRVDAGIRRATRIGSIGLVVGIVALTAIAWSAAPWAPAGAVGAFSLIAVSAWLRLAKRRRLPRVRVDEAAQWVTLRGVNAEFAAAVDR